MDMELMRRLEREADERDQTLAVLEHWKRKAERRRFWAFCFNWRQVVDEPVAAVATSEAPAFVSGVASGAVGFRDGPQPPVSHTPGGARRLAGPAGPTTPIVRPVRGAGPATPPHPTHKTGPVPRAETGKGRDPSDNRRA